MVEGKTMVLILAAVAFSVVGQLFLKSGAQHLVGLGRLEFLLAAARDTHVLSGLVAWIASTVCWLYVLRVAPLSRAYGLASRTASSRCESAASSMRLCWSGWVVRSSGSWIPACGCSPSGIGRSGKP